MHATSNDNKNKNDKILTWYLACAKYQQLTFPYANCSKSQVTIIHYSYSFNMIHLMILLHISLIACSFISLKTSIWLSLIYPFCNYDTFLRLCNTFFGVAWSFALRDIWGFNWELPVIQNKRCWINKNSFIGKTEAFYRMCFTGTYEKSSSTPSVQFNFICIASITIHRLRTWHPSKEDNGK